MKIQKIVLFLLFFSLLGQLRAGKIDRAFEALKRYDYFTAKELFEKIKDKEPVAAPYGLSIIFGRDDNPFYNLDSAYHYIKLAEINYPPEELGHLEDLGEIGINDTVLANWKDSVDLLVWNEVSSKNELEAYERFIAKHSDALQKEEAISRRNQLAFDLAREINSARAYLSFIEKYPEAEQITEAQNRYETQLFLELTEDQEIFSFESFIKQYPESPYKEEAQDSIYRKSTIHKNIPEYEAFIKKYPDNHNVDKAWRNIYKLYTADYSTERILEFKMTYPEYPFVDELKTDMKLASMVFFPFKNQGKYGFMDEEGQVLIDAEYEFVESFNEGLSLLIQDGKIGFINKAGDLIIPFDYDDGEPFDDGLAIVSIDDRYGMIDRTNKAVIPLKYDLIGRFKHGLALVANETAYGFVDKEGKVAIPIELDYANDFEKAYALIEIDGKKGIINTKGRQVIEAKYDYLENFNQYGLARAKNDSAYGLIDQQGSEILPFEYDRIGEFGDSLALVAKGDKYGYVNHRGEMVIPLKYDFDTEALVWGLFESGYAKFKLKDKYGILNMKGEEVYPAIFEDVGAYTEEGWIAVKKKDKWGYADQKVKLQLPYEYELARSFKNGMGKVREATGWQMVNESGEKLLDSAAMEIISLDTFLLVSWNGKFGLFDQRLDSLLPADYDGIRSYEYHYLQLKQGEDLIYYDPKLKKLIGLKEE
jgi:hypothetical protein